MISGNILDEFENVYFGLNVRTKDHGKANPANMLMGADR